MLNSKYFQQNNENNLAAPSGKLEYDIGLYSVDYNFKNINK